MCVQDPNSRPHDRSVTNCSPKQMAPQALLVTLESPYFSSGFRE